MTDDKREALVKEIVNFVGVQYMPREEASEIVAMCEQALRNDICDEVVDAVDNENWTDQTTMSGMVNKFKVNIKSIRIGYLCPSLF